MKIEHVILLLIILAAPIVAADLSYTNPNLPKLEPPQRISSVSSGNGSTNFSTYADIWITAQGFMDNVPDLFPTLDNVYCLLTGCEITGDLIVEQTITVEDLQVDNDLNVIGDINGSRETICMGTARITSISPDQYLLDPTGSVASAGSFISGYDGSIRSLNVVSTNSCSGLGEVCQIEIRINGGSIYNRSTDYGGGTVADVVTFERGELNISQYDFLNLYWETLNGTAATKQVGGCLELQYDQ